MNLRPLSLPTTIILILIAFGAGYIMAQSPTAPITIFESNASPNRAQREFEPFWEVWELVHTQYLRQPVNDTELVEGAIDGMLATLDDQHTVYLSPEDQAEAVLAMSGEFQGIGAEVEDVDGNITVVAPIDGSPADEAGIMPGDILREADGIELTGMDLSEAAGLVRGTAGTTVHLVVERDGEIFELDIIRDVIKLASVRGELLAENLAYIRLSRFANATHEELQEILTDLLAENPGGLILDLRRNPGGLLDVTVDIADEFLPEGVILFQQSGNGSQKVFEATDDGVAEDIPLVVLIDEGSASAAEVLAGAIQDRERGVVIGQTSFGKGTVQTWQTLSNNGGIRLTIAQWLTPNEFSIHEAGLTPDYFIPYSEEAFRANGEDTQLQAAIDYLTGKTIISVPPESEG